MGIVFGGEKSRLIWEEKEGERDNCFRCFVCTPVESETWRKIGFCRSWEAVFATGKGGESGLGWSMVDERSTAAQGSVAVNGGVWRLEDGRGEGR